MQQYHCSAQNVEKSSTIRGKILWMNCKTSIWFYLNYVTAYVCYDRTLGWAKFWNIVIFSHIIVSWGSSKRKSVVTSPIVQSWAPGKISCWTIWTNHRAEQPKQPITGQNSIILRLVPGAQLCTMGDVTTLFLFVEPQLTKIWLNNTMFQNFAQPNRYEVVL